MKTAIKIVGMFIYTAVYVVLAADLTGAGHSTFIFFAPLPTWILGLLALALCSRLANPTVRVMIPILLIVQYLVIAASVISYVNDGSELLSRRWHMSPDYVVGTIIWYCLGQLGIWAVFFWELRRLGKIE